MKSNLSKEIGTQEVGKLIRECVSKKKECAKNKLYRYGVRLF